MTDDKDSTDPTNLGNISRAFTDDVTGVHVLRALKYQKENPDAKIGDALVATGAIDEATRDALLRKQEDIRAGKHSVKDVTKMLDYATKRTTSASDKVVAFLKSLK